MFYNFKTWRAPILSLLCLSSCSWIHNTPKVSPDSQPTSLDISCVDKVPNQLKNLFAGNYSDSKGDQEQVKSLWKCIDHALNTFENFTRGENPDFYSAAELQAFANRFLPKEKPLNDTFVDSIFKLKAAEVGGSSDRLTRSEIEGVRKKLNRFGEIILPLSPYLGVLLDQKISDSDTKKIASVKLRQFVSDLSSVLADSAAPVTWDNLLSFVMALESYTNGENTSALTLVKEQLPIYKYFKLLLVGGDADLIERDKWKPIFDGISHLYNALILSSNTVELLEQLDIEVQSTVADEAKAVGELVGLLKVLKKDSKLQSKKMIDLLSDRLAKALLINGVLFPKDTGSLSIKTFLKTDSIRKLAGYIIDDALKLDLSKIDSNKISIIADNALLLIDQASISNQNSMDAPDHLDMSKMEAYLDQIAPLFSDESQYRLVRSAFHAIDYAIPLLIGHNKDGLTPKDLRALIQKGIALYTTWNERTDQGTLEKISATFDTVLRAPSVSSIPADQILKGVTAVQTLFQQFKPGLNIDWNLISSYIVRGLKTKSYLFQSSETYLTHYEIDELAFLFDSFRSSPDQATRFTTLASRLIERPIMTAQLSDLTSMADSFLPDGQKIADFGLSPILLGDVKSLLFGGDHQTISSHEFSLLSKLIGQYYFTLDPQIKNLPSNFKIGLNSDTLNLAATAIETLSESSNERMSLVELKQTVGDYVVKGGYKPREFSLNFLVDGLYQRVFNQLKTPKPKKPDGLTFTAQQLLPMAYTIRAIASDLRLVENVFDTNSSKDQLLLKKEFLLKTLASSEDLVTILNRLDPLLIGPNDTLHLPTRTEVNDQFSRFDLVYKTVVYKFLKWIFPLYKVNPDPVDNNLNRLDFDGLTDLETDINYLIYDIKLSFSDSTPEDSTKARMKSINLFTRSGNGDQFVDPIETTEFLTVTIGGKDVLGQIEKTLLPLCFPNVTTYGQIPDRKIPFSCLTEHFFEPKYFESIYGNVTPQLLDQFKQWDANSINTFRKAAFTSTESNWTEDGSMLLDDLEVFTSLPYYVEILFERMDTNQIDADHRDWINLEEAMAAFPIFCREINKQILSMGLVKGPVDACEPGGDNSNARATYGYILIHQSTPSSSGGGKASFLSRLEFKIWKLIWHVKENHPGKKMKKLRIDRATLFNIMSNLASGPSTPAPAPADLQTESQLTETYSSELQDDEQPESP